jgi:adenosylcobyric acid synthase
VVGDIHRGGVFAHLYGTVAILPDELRQCVKGFIINMFRGDRALLGDAMEQLEARCGVPTLGVLPYLPGLVLDAEDSLHRYLDAAPAHPREAGTGANADLLDVVVLRLPRLSNFTDADPLVTEPALRVRFVDHPVDLGRPDLIVIPGTKSTVADLQWLRSTGLAASIEEQRRSPSPPVILGVCGGFQMLGRSIEDPDAVESGDPSTAGLGYLPLRTRFLAGKTTRLRNGTGPDGSPVRGYEIRHGRTTAQSGSAVQAWLMLEGSAESDDIESARDPSGLVFGTSLHGLFEEDAFRSAFLGHVAAARGKEWQPSGLSFADARHDQIDRVADACGEYLDTDALWRLVEEAATGPAPGA